jgi:hypothetical protein
MSNGFKASKTANNRPLREEKQAVAEARRKIIALAALSPTADGNYAGTCPLCGSDGRSFAVSSRGDRATWRCFGQCGKTGAYLQLLEWMLEKSMNDCAMWYECVQINKSEIRRSRREAQEEADAAAHAKASCALASDTLRTLASLCERRAEQVEIGDLKTKPRAEPKR